MNHLAREPNTIIGITGTPGTGKKSVGRIIADKSGYCFLDMNNIAIKTVSMMAIEEEDFEVDPEKLRRCVLEQLKNNRVVLVGHLLPQILYKDEVDFVAILRCAPKELERRYADRNYSEDKIKDNILSEILDICFVDSLNRYGNKIISEFDTTGQQPENVAQEILMVLRGLKKRSFGSVSWLTDTYAKGLIQKYLC